MDKDVTVAEAARRLGRSIEQIRRYLREGRLPGRRIGQQWFIEEEALAAWRPSRRGAAGGRVGEAVAVYEATPTKSEAMKTNRRLVDDDLIADIERLREKIRRDAGEFDVVALVREDREEH